MDLFTRYHARKRGMKIAAMAEQIRRAVSLLRRFAEDHVEAHFAGVVLPVVPGAWIKCAGAHQGFEAEPAQHLHRVTADLNAGAEPGKSRSLLVDVDTDARPMQRAGSCKATHARAHNRDRESGHIATSEGFVTATISFCGIGDRSI